MWSVLSNHEFGQTFVCIFVIFSWGSSKCNSWTSRTMQRTWHNKNHHYVPWKKHSHDNLRQFPIMKLNERWHQFCFFINGANDRIRCFKDFLIDESLFGKMNLVQNDSGVPSEKKLAQWCFFLMSHEIGQTFVAICEFFWWSSSKNHSWTKWKMLLTSHDKDQ